MARSQRDLQREQMWRGHVTRQQASGMTVRAYCRHHGLHESGFYFWRREIAERDRTRATVAVPAFVPVAVVADPVPAPATRRRTAAIDICLGDGRRVRVRPGCDRALLADVLAILAMPAREGRSC